MNPLSPLYFIKQNKSRCILLMFMTFLSFGAYLGGSYIYTPQENWDYACELDEKMVSVYARADDEDYKNYHKFVEEIKKTDNIHAIECAWYNQMKQSWASRTEASLSRSVQLTISGISVSITILNVISRM